MEIISSLWDSHYEKALLKVLILRKTISDHII